jgi:hypothetical protein
MGGCLIINKRWVISLILEKKKKKKKGISERTLHIKTVRMWVMRSLGDADSPRTVLIVDPDQGSSWITSVKVLHAFHEHERISTWRCARLKKLDVCGAGLLQLLLLLQDRAMLSPLDITVLESGTGCCISAPSVERKSVTTDRPRLCDLVTEGTRRVLDSSADATNGAKFFLFRRRRMNEGSWHL